MKPTLFLLAAGMGSRYGGLKQLDGLGPNGETIMDYSIYDAIQAGFGKIVWVIRKDFEEQFRTQILSKYEGKVQCEPLLPGTRRPSRGLHRARRPSEAVGHEPRCAHGQGRDQGAVLCNQLRRLLQPRCFHGHRQVPCQSPRGRKEPVCDGGLPCRQHPERERHRGPWHLLEERQGSSDDRRGAHGDCALCCRRLQCRCSLRAHPLQG